MAGKRLVLTALLLGLLACTGCCRACRYWCDSPPPPATPVGCAAAPACCYQPVCCPPGTVPMQPIQPVQPVPMAPAPGRWNAPAFSAPIGCCAPN